MLSWQSDSILNSHYCPYGEVHGETPESEGTRGVCKMGKCSALRRRGVGSEQEPRAGVWLVWTGWWARWVFAAICWLQTKLWGIQSCHLGGGGQTMGGWDTESTVASHVAIGSCDRLQKEVKVKITFIQEKAAQVPPPQLFAEASPLPAGQVLGRTNPSRAHNHQHPISCSAIWAPGAWSIPV